MILKGTSYSGLSLPNLTSFCENRVRTAACVEGVVFILHSIFSLSKMSCLTFIGTCQKTNMDTCIVDYFKTNRQLQTFKVNHELFQISGSFIS